MSSRRSVTTRRLIALGTLVGLSALVVVMVAVRISATGSLNYFNLVWNLVLAWIPLGLALILYDGARRGVAGRWLLSIGALWLLFLPNAPYLTTDLKYVRELGGAPVWYDAVMTGAAAFTGLALGFLSLFLVHAVAQRRFGAMWAWVSVWAILLVSSVGVFLGRFQRFNSWDVFTDPGAIVSDLAKGASDPLNYPKVIAVTIVFSAFLLGGYAVFYALARVSRLLDDEPQSV
jgi:uncharacterized membrane protein